MKIVILDTNVLIDNVHGYAKWVDDLLKNLQYYQLIVPTIVASEYLTTQTVETKTGHESSMNYLFMFQIQDLNFGIAEVLGKILRRKTYVSGAGLADLIIAATTLHLDGQLATRNKADFAKIPDLRFFDPKKLEES